MTNSRLTRAKGIVARGEITIHAFSVQFPGYGNCRMVDFVCLSQSRPNLDHEGSVMYNGALIEEEGTCDCEDWTKGNLCMHAQAALLADGADLEALLA